MSKFKRKKRSKKTFELSELLEYFIYSILIVVGVLSTVSSRWTISYFGKIKFGEIIYHLFSPLEGTGQNVVSTYIIHCIPITVIISFLLIYLIYKFTNKYIDINIKFKKKKININISSNARRIIISLFIFILTIDFALNKISFYDYIKDQINDSPFIAQNFVDPETVNITFNEKRNLIYIFLESMETTYEELGLIPELTNLKNNNVNFNTNHGGYNLGNSSWTMAAMIAHTTGIPLLTEMNGNLMGQFEYFLPGAVSMGEILEQNGYTNYLLVGSDSEFGGRKKYFEQHGNYNIWDFYSAVANNDKNDSDYVYWGFDDSDLFKYAKKALNNLDKNEPFNYTILTVNTHFPEGYLEEWCPTPYNDQYSNVISCSSKQVADFVSWIQQQSWYENTTIVLAGDHLSMSDAYFEDLKLNNDRSIYVTIINPAIPYEMGNKEFSTYDLFPTTLAAIGAEIEGNRLALGTNLFSDELTIVEKYGKDYAHNELFKKSLFYSKKFKYYE